MHSSKSVLTSTTHSPNPVRATRRVTPVHARAAYTYVCAWLNRSSPSTSERHQRDVQTTCRSTAKASAARAPRAAPLTSSRTVRDELMTCRHAYPMHLGMWPRARPLQTTLTAPATIALDAPTPTFCMHHRVLPLQTRQAHRSSFPLTLGCRAAASGSALAASRLSRRPLPLPPHPCCPRRRSRRRRRPLRRACRRPACRRRRRRHPRRRLACAPTRATAKAASLASATTAERETCTRRWRATLAPTAPTAASVSTASTARRHVQLACGHHTVSGDQSFNPQHRQIVVRSSARERSLVLISTCTCTHAVPPPRRMRPIHALTRRCHRRPRAVLRGCGASLQACFEAALASDTPCLQSMWDDGVCDAACNNVACVHNDCTTAQVIEKCLEEQARRTRCCIALARRPIHTTGSDTPLKHAASLATLRVY